MGRIYQHCAVTTSLPTADVDDLRAQFTQRLQHGTHLLTLLFRFVKRLSSSINLAFIAYPAARQLERRCSPVVNNASWFKQHMRVSDARACSNSTRLDMLHGSIPTLVRIVRVAL